MLEGDGRIRVTVVNTKLHNPNSHIVLSFVTALEKDSRVGSVRLCSYDDVIRSVQSGCDLLIALDGEAAQPEILRRASALAPRSALWSWEDPYETRAIQELAPLFDHVFTNDQASTSSYESADFLPLAASALFDMRDVREDDACDYDVSFVGSPWPSRIRFLRAMMRLRPHLKWKIALAYNPHVPRGYLEIPESDYRQSPSHFDFVEIANRSRVVLSIHRDFAGSGKNVAAANPGPRVFEVALAGGFQIVDRREASVESFFDATELATFASAEECAAEVDRALTEPTARIERARAAQERTLREHLYENRAKKLLDVMALRPPRAPVERPARPRILFVTHNVLTAGEFGGVEVYQELIRDRLQQNYDIFFYYQDRAHGDSGDRAYLLAQSDGRIIDRKVMRAFDANLTLWSADTENAFTSILIDHEINLVHYHHLMEHTLSLPIISRALGVPSVLALHDYFLVCHRYNLLDFTGKFCRIHERPDIATCDICLKEGERREQGSQSYRRAFMQTVLESVDLLLSASRSAVDILEGVYPQSAGAALRKRILTLPTSAPPIPALRPVVAPNSASKPPLRVVFLGNFSANKGADTFISVARQLADANIEFTICGRIDPPFGQVLAETALRNVTVAGPYVPAKLDLSQFDVSLHLSNWPETYCLTLSEAWASGLAPIVSRIGALDERVADRVDGFKVPVDGRGELLVLLLELIHDRALLNSVKEKVRNRLWVDVDQHLSELIPAYEELMKEAPSAVGPGLRSPRAARIDMEILGIASGSPRWDQPSLVRNGELPKAPPLRLAPLAAPDLALAKRNFEMGRVERLSKSVVTLAQFGPYFANNAARFSVFHPPLKSYFRVHGHLIRPLAGNIGPTVLALRSFNDVILREVAHIDSHLVPDGTAEEFKFVSEPISLELLEETLYGVYFATLGRTKIILDHLNFTLKGGAQPLFVGAVERAGVVVAPQVVTAGPAAAEAARDGIACDVGTVDLRFMDAAGAQVLTVWVRPKGAEPALEDSLTLELRGPQIYNAFISPARRSGSWPAAVRRADQGCASVWIAGLPPGRYELAVRSSAGAGGRQRLRIWLDVAKAGLATLTRP